MSKRVLVGIVTADKTPKTRRVEVMRLAQHPKYGKTLRRRTICYVHDENDESHLGDTVEIEESRPLSRTKRWRLVRVVAKSRLVDLSELRSAARGRPRAELEETETGLPLGGLPPSPPQA